MGKDEQSKVMAAYDTIHDEIEKLAKGLTKDITGFGREYNVFAVSHTKRLDDLNEEKKKLKKLLQDRINDLKPGIIRPKDAPKEEKVHAIFTANPKADSLYIRMDKAFKANESWAHWLTQKATFGKIDTSDFREAMETIFNGPEREKLIRHVELIKETVDTYDFYIKNHDVPWYIGILEDRVIILREFLSDYYAACCAACFKCLAQREERIKEGLKSLGEVSTDELAKCYLLVTAVCGKKLATLKAFNVDFRGVVGKECIEIYKELYDLMLNRIKELASMPKYADIERRIVPAWNAERNW